MDTLLSRWPFAVTVAVLYLIVLARAGATYAAGRGIQAGTRRTRLAAHLESARFLRAQALVRRWGAPLVAASFLTVGFQTLANLAAGLLEMPLRRYLPALALGGAVWAVLYATAGLVSLGALWQLVGVHPVVALSLAGTAVLVLAVATILRRRNRNRSRSEGGA